MPSMKLKTEDNVSPELFEACRDLSVLLDRLPLEVEVSALITLVCRSAVMYDINREVFLKSLGEGYDAFKLMVADGPMQ